MRSMCCAHSVSFNLKTNKKKSVEGNFILTGFVPDQVLSVVSWPQWNQSWGSFTGIL